jgi:protein SCO1/2
MKPAVLALLLAALAGCRTSPPGLPDYGLIPEFQLTDQRGNRFDSRELNGKVWVADFIFTTCTSFCPRMTSQMHQVQSALLKVPDVRLVSFTVDPARDTPPVLAQYATAVHASPQLWYFLTGAQQMLQHLDRDVFKLGNVDGSLMHSTRFILVDQQEHIRGYYDTSEGGSIPRLVEDVHVLLRERA